MNQLRDYRLYLVIVLMIPIIASYVTKESGLGSITKDLDLGSITKDSQGLGSKELRSEYEILNAAQLATNETYGQGYADYHEMWVDHYQANWDESIDYNNWCKHSQQVAKYGPKGSFKHYMILMELLGYPRNNAYEKFGGYYNPETTIFYKKNGKPCKNNDPLTTRCRAYYLVTKVMNIPVASTADS